MLFFNVKNTISMNLSINNLSKSFGKQNVLKDICVEFSSGNIYCILGKNGAGKSTLINIVIGLIKQDSGIIKYNDRSYISISLEIKRNIGFMNENDALIEELTGYQYLDLMGQFYSIDIKEKKIRINELIEFFFEDRDSILKKRISSYSTGMKKKLEICSAVLHKPNLLILDEPFSGLDPISSEKVINFLNAYKSPLRTIIFSSHNLNYVEIVNPIILLLDDSTIKFKGLADELRNVHNANFHESILKEMNYKNSNVNLSWL